MMIIISMMKTVGLKKNANDLMIQYKDMAWDFDQQEYKCAGFMYEIRRLVTKYGDGIMPIFQECLENKTYEKYASREVLINMFVIGNIHVQGDIYGKAAEATLINLLKNKNNDPCLRESGIHGLANCGRFDALETQYGVESRGRVSFLLADYLSKADLENLGYSFVGNPHAYHLFDGDKKRFLQDTKDYCRFHGVDNFIYFASCVAKSRYVNDDMKNYVDGLDERVLKTDNY